MQKTSIIIPCWIIDKSLLELTKECVDSLRRTTKNYELIIVDDGSPMGVSDLKKLADIYIRNRKNLGFAKTVNKGWQKATGKYIITCNNDILVPPGWQEIMIKWLNEPDVGAVSLINTRDKITDNSQPFDQRQDRHVIEGGCYFHGGFWGLTRETINKIGFLDERFIQGGYEDIDYFYRLIKANLKLICSFERWIWHKEGATRKITEEKRLLDEKISEENLQRFIKKWHNNPHTDCWFKLNEILVEEYPFKNK